MAGVVRGTIPACKSIRLAVERHLRDLRDGKKRGLSFDEGAAQHAIDFFGFLKHSKGEWAGEAFTLAPWQQAVLWILFGWMRADGTRRFRVSYVEVPRKNGKSTLAAGVGLYLFVADGEPGAEVYSAATKKDQALITHQEATRMVRASRGLTGRIGIFKNNLHVEGTASKYEPLGADADTLDGLNIHGAVIDELHAHKTRALWDVLDTATGARRQPLIFAITTAGYDRNSVCWEQHEYGLKVLEGIIDDDSFFAFIATIDDGDDWRDPVTWAKANPNLGVSVKPDDLERKAEKAAMVPAAQNAFRQKHLDEWTEQSERWLDMTAWDHCPKAASADELRGRRCFGGLDLANTTDIAALELVFPPEDDGEPWKVLSWFFVPADNARERSKRDRVPYEQWIREGFITATDGNVIDYDAIRGAIHELADQFEIVEMGYDPWNAHQIVTQLQGDGLVMVPVRQGFTTLSAPTKDLEKLVIARKIDHGGNPVLRWMVSNVTVKMDAAGNLKPDKSKSTERIDGVVACIIGLSRAIVQDDGGSVYDGRGLAAL